MTFCYIILFCSSLISFIMPLITPFHSSKALVPGTSFFPAQGVLSNWNNINIHFPDSSKHASQFFTSFPRTFYPLPWLFHYLWLPTSQTSIKHLTSTTAFFFIQVVSCVTTATTHLEKLSFWFSLKKSLVSFFCLGFPSSSATENLYVLLVHEHLE